MKKYNPLYLREKLKGIFQKHKVKAAYLFGSQCKGKLGAMSDVDIAVLWPETQGMPTMASLRLQREVSGILQDDRIQVGPLNAQALSFCYQVIKDGALLFGSEGDKVKYETYILNEYLDFSVLAEEYNKIFRKSILRKSA